MVGILFVSMAVASAVETKVIAAGFKYTEDIKLGNANLRILDLADVMGNIFIEEGDLFLLKEVKITGTTTLGNGTANIGEISQLTGNIFIEEGDLFRAGNVNVVGSITIKKGNIFIKDQVTVTQDVTIKKREPQDRQFMHSEGQRSVQKRNRGHGRRQHHFRRCVRHGFEAGGEFRHSGPLL
jgi:hypothetical protein